MMLVAKDIYKCYHRRDILKGVDLMAKPGECVGVIGSNGCGKTTLLSILAGTVRADRGQIQEDTMYEETRKIMPGPWPMSLRRIL